jgi:hypothetical protein
MGVEQNGLNPAGAWELAPEGGWLCTESPWVVVNRPDTALHITALHYGFYVGAISIWDLGGAQVRRPVFQLIFWDLGPGHKPDISLEKYKTAIKLLVAAAVGCRGTKN